MESSNLKDIANKLYIVDFAKSLAKAKNLPAVLYLVLNIWIMYSVFNFVVNDWKTSLMSAIVIYISTLFVALSPVGEWLLRVFHGCSKIKDPAILSRLEPLFVEVKKQAQVKYPELHVDDSIRLYIRDDGGVNAFAVGRRTVCVTRGLLQLSDEEIKAVLGHEFGHLATHDTDLILLITIGNFFISAIAGIIRFVIALFQFVANFICSIVGQAEGAIARFFFNIATFLHTFILDGFMFLWTKLGIWLVMKTSRDAEYVADEFSCDLGYRDGLLSFFRGLVAEEHQAAGTGNEFNIFQALNDSHPSTQKRIDHLLSTEYAKT